MPVIAEIASRQPILAEWRRMLHTMPELGFEEEKTAAFVVDRLQAMGIEAHTGMARTGVIGIIEGRPGNRRIGLRADMDALPMEELGNPAWKSKNPGRFHGCGHDGHTVMLLAAAEYLAHTRAFAGTVVLIFQPAEEGLGGGRVMVEEGLFDRFPCDEIYALHNMPLLPVGQAAVRIGAALASFDRFDVTITGRGGHAAMPHKTIDPAIVMSQMVLALQALISRETDPMESAVLSVTEMHVGTTHNVIASEGRIAGTVRALNEAARARIETGFHRIVTHVAEAYGASVRIEYAREFPVLVNDGEAVDRATLAIADVLGSDGLAKTFPPLMAAEDFAFMLQKRPGAYILVGQGKGPDSPMVHHPEYDFNDAIIATGASLFVKLAESALKAD
ncbi:M20 aminoacylase family protein [Methylocella sp. CPCC 101449]|uniref:M20 aminoacylase family protein n=1 Tax=Methylocella sp. CPCC 101449 TaxID=2987531 RepID=UPI00288F97AE|nr:M20 aminoacylase family protein [Methylocella sp. CPCC 101449]MDT2019544.1 M20 family metallopeptidase [Methylocella sp. CPCC 101449]